MSLHGFEIIQYLEQHAGQAITIRQLAKQTGKSYGATYNAVHELAKEGILTLADVGASTLCRANLASDKAVAMLTCASMLRAADTMTEEERRATRTAAHHLRDVAITIWFKDNELYAVLRSHATVHMAGGLPVKTVSFNEIYPGISENAKVVFGAENYWRLAAERGGSHD